MDIHSPAHPDPSPCPGPLSERTERHLRMLAELAEIGMALARQVGRQALDAGGLDGDSLDGDLGLVFSRIARAVRQTVALEARLEADARAVEVERSAAMAGREAAQRVRVRQQKVRLKKLVEQTISSEAEMRDAENLRLDLDERLDDPDVDAELGWRPIGVIYAAICQDLGIKADLKQFSDAELGFDRKPAGAGLAALQARVGGPGDLDRSGDGDPCDDDPGEDGEPGAVFPRAPPD
jgi:hypothetical protein